MSVLIKGMEMPSDEIGQCGYTDIRVWYDGTVEVLRGYHIQETSQKAIPVPPHGRLVDADKIYNAVEQRYKMSSGIEHRCYRELLDLICEVPTIIEAEEGE